MDTLQNTAIANGTYDALPTSLTSNAVVTQLISGLTINKTADKQLWSNGNLQYTITVSNKAADPFTDITVTDTLDPTKIKLVDNSVKLNGTSTEYTYNAETGLLTVVISDLAASASGIVTFLVTKI